MDQRQQKNLSVNNSQFTDLRAILKKYVYHWPVFIVGLLVALAVAYAYMRMVNPVYEISATILVKDDKKAPDEKSQLPELEQSGAPKNAETEIEIIRSKNLVGQVVDSLQLWTSFKTSQGVKSADLYQTTPVRFALSKKTGVLSGNKIDVFIKDKNSFVMQNLGGQKETVPFNSAVNSDFGTWLLTPTSFLEQYIGSTITIYLHEPDLVSNNYIKALDAHLLDKQAPTIGLFVTDEVPKRGEDFLDNLIKAYNQAAFVEQKKKTKSTIDFIDKRLASLTGELNHAEQNVQGYRSSQGLADISSQAQAYIENQSANNGKLDDVNIQLGVLNGIEAYVNSPSNNDNVPTTMGISDPAFNNLIGKLSELQLKKTSLLATTPASNPIFEPINKQIDVTKSAVKESIKGIKASLLSSKRGLESFNNKFQSSIRVLPNQEREVGDMKRQQSIKENLYVYLLQKREELALSYASTFVDARIVDKANIGDIKWPRTSVVYLIALLAGLGIPFLIIYFRDSFTNKVVSRRDIETGVNIPIMGELAYEEIEKNAIVVNKVHHLIGEQFRALRSNLHYVHQTKTLSPIYHASAQKDLLLAGALPDNVLGNDKGRVTLVTSSISKEGKSFVSTNIAASLAISGRKTIILEMDLRKPKVSGIFNLPTNHPGISEYLSSYNVVLSSIIQHVDKIANLDIIGCGRIPSEPSELLESERLADLIGELKEVYDDIIIDTPPLHLVTDAMIIARLAEVSLYVVRQGYTGKEELTFLHETNQTEKFPNMNIVFNGIKKIKYGYGYNYDNSYYNDAPLKTPANVQWKRFLARF
jgi:tyrosine-protein kinase Etk/Wzc